MSKHNTIMLADDHELVRKGIMALFAHHAEFKIVGEASNGKELVEKMRLGAPDLVLLDLEMPVMNGDETLKVIRSEFPRVKIIILSMHFDHDLVNHFIKRGVSAYIPKGTDAGILVDAVFSVRNNHCYFPDLSDEAKDWCPDADGRKFLLTEKEIDVLKLICSGLSSHEIAEKIGLSVNTVDYHRKNIYAKTKINKVAQLTLFAVRNNIISPRD